MHRYRECLENASIGHEDIINTKRLSANAKKEGHETASALWCGGILPRHMCRSRALMISTAEATPVAYGRFNKLLRETQRAGIDGG